MLFFLILIILQLVLALDSEESHPSGLDKLGTFKELLKESIHQQAFHHPSTAFSIHSLDVSNIDIIAFHP